MFRNNCEGLPIEPIPSNFRLSSGPRECHGTPSFEDLASSQLHRPAYFCGQLLPYYRRPLLFVKNGCCLVRLASIGRAKDGPQTMVLDDPTGRAGLDPVKHAADYGKLQQGLQVISRASTF